VDPIANQLEDVVVALITGDRASALPALRAIDFGALVKLRTCSRSRAWARPPGETPYRASSPRAKRLDTSSAVKRATFARDKYTCRYAHCQRRTVDLEVLKLLSTAFPGVLPYHSNWKPVEDHILYWTYSTSLEHIISFPAGGTSHPDNLVTACYLCNDTKNRLPLERLGWVIGPPAESTWSGLIEYRTKLSKVVNQEQIPVIENGMPDPQLPTK
jgi:5-methylcytosine-specific restriction endonuclease McrA